MNLNQKLAKKLKDARIHAGYVTAKDFSQKNNLPYTTYAQHESGKRCLSARIILKYSKLLKVEPVLFLGSDKKETEKYICSNVEKKDNDLIDKKIFLQIVKNIINHHKIVKKSISIIKISEIAVSVYNYMSSKKNIGN